MGRCSGERAGKRSSKHSQWYSGMHGILHRNGAPGRNAEDVSGKRGSEKRLFSRGNQQTKAGPARMLAPDCRLLLGDGG